MPSTREFTTGWARVGVVTWAAVLLAEVAVAITSRTVGKPPWWLGPSTDPAPFVLAAIPLALVVIPAVLFARSHPGAPRIAALCAIALVVVGVVDIDATPGVAVVECAIAFAALLGSLSTNAGLFTRR